MIKESYLIASWIDAYNSEIEILRFGFIHGYQHYAGLCI